VSSVGPALSRLRPTLQFDVALGAVSPEEIVRGSAANAA